MKNVRVFLSEQGLPVPVVPGGKVKGRNNPWPWSSGGELFCSITKTLLITYQRYDHAIALFVFCFTVRLSFTVQAVLYTSFTMSPGIQNIILPVSEPPYGLTQNTSPFFVCRSYLHYQVRARQLSLGWIHKTKCICCEISHKATWLSLYSTQWQHNNRLCPYNTCLLCLHQSYDPGINTVL